MLNKIAREISELENMPKNEEYFEACVLIAENLYNLNYNDAYTVAEIIQNNYLNK